MAGLKVVDAPPTCKPRAPGQRRARRWHGTSPPAGSIILLDDPTTAIDKITALKRDVGQKADLLREAPRKRKGEEFHEALHQRSHPAGSRPVGLMGDVVP